MPLLCVPHAHTLAPLDTRRLPSSTDPSLPPGSNPERHEPCYHLNRSSRKDYTAGSAVLDMCFRPVAGDLMGLHHLHPTVASAQDRHLTAFLREYGWAALLGVLGFQSAIPLSKQGGSFSTLLPLFWTVLSAWYFGFRPGLLTLGLAAGLSATLTYSTVPLLTSASGDWTRLLLLIPVGVVVVTLVSRGRNSLVELQDLVAARDRLLDEANVAEARLKDALRTKDEFLGLVSHEVRTPLTVIVGNARVLQKAHGRLPADAEDVALTDMVIEGERLQRLVDNMLLVAKGDVGRSPVAEPLRLPRLVAETVERFKAAHADARITVTSVPDLPMAFAEPSLVSIVFENLVMNAYKYSPRSSITEVIIQRSDQGWPEIIVRDRGIGISEADSEKVFEPFFRADAVKLQSGGVGLGLALSKRLVEAFGGEIFCNPRAGGGAEFAFTVPPLNELLLEE
jgi:signal transduction histidine kinase